MKGFSTVLQFEMVFIGVSKLPIFELEEVIWHFPDNIMLIMNIFILKKYIVGISVSAKAFVYVYWPINVMGKATWPLKYHWTQIFSVFGIMLYLLQRDIKLLLYSILPATRKITTVAVNLSHSSRHLAVERMQTTFLYIFLE